MVTKELIEKRRSIRKYNMDKLSGEKLLEIERYIKEIKPLTNNGVFSYKIIDNRDFVKNTKGAFRINAPHYLLLFGDKSDDSYRNIGFIGEQIVLKLAQMNIGTCWLGGAKSSDTILDQKYTISIAFGNTDEEFRKNIDEFKRKELEEIAIGYGDDQKDLLNLARIAPSAMNLQPWFFQCEPNVIHVFRRNPSGLFKLSSHLKTMQKIDIGIVMSHFLVRPFVYKKLDLKNKGMKYEGSIYFEQTIFVL